MVLENKTFKEIGEYFNSFMSDIIVATSTERAYVRGQAVRHLKRNCNANVEIYGGHNSSFKTKLNGTISPFGEEIKYDAHILFSVSIKTTGKTVKTGRIKTSDVCTVPPKPFKFKELMYVYIDMPTYEFNKDGVIQKSDGYSGNFNIRDIDGIYDCNSIQEMSPLIEDYYKQQIYNSMVQPALKRIAFDRKAEKTYKKFGKEYIERFINGESVDDFCEEMAKYGIENGVIIK